MEFRIHDLDKSLNCLFLLSKIKHMKGVVSDMISEKTYLVMTSSAYFLLRAY